MNNFKPLTIAITGGSASGKTTFAKVLAESLSEYSPVILHQDNYFRDWSEYPSEIREKVITANHPDAVRWEALTDHVQDLVGRRQISFPIPGTRAFSRGEAKRDISPGDILLVEGHLILWHEVLRSLMDIKIFLDVDPHERVLRRLLRETGQGGVGNLEKSAAWYRKDVIPNFPLYTESCKRYADLIIPFIDKDSLSIRLLASGARELIEDRKKKEL